MRKAIYPGTFDPITKGHLDIIERSSELFEEVFVVIMKNGAKKTLFDENERLDMIEKEVSHLKNVKVLIGNGLTIQFAKKLGCQVIIRGIRATSDYEYELQIATANMMLDGQIETLFMLSKPQYSFVSSSTVKEIASYGGELDKFVTPYIKEKLMEKQA